MARASMYMALWHPALAVGLLALRAAGFVPGDMAHAPHVRIPPAVSSHVASHTGRLDGEAVNGVLPKPKRARMHVKGLPALESKRRRVRKRQKSPQIGTPGHPWGLLEKKQWLASRRLRRSYSDEVLAQLVALQERYVVQQYGALSIDPQRYPLVAVTTHHWSAEKPCVLITGGVHGFEKSGVQGAILFLETEAAAFSEFFNIVVVPCVSPWGYEAAQRWTTRAVDPNRSFNPGGKFEPGRGWNPGAATEESSALIGLLESLDVKQWICHIDLHETSRTHEAEFRQAKAARDGLAHSPSVIPDGFYLVSDMTARQLDMPAWHAGIIDAVSQVMPIAPPDKDDLEPGVIGIPSPRLCGLCSGVTDAPYATITEVYPDTPGVSADQCQRAQVAAIVAGLRYIAEVALKTASDL